MKTEQKKKIPNEEVENRSDSFQIPEPLSKKRAKRIILIFVMTSLLTIFFAVYENHYLDRILVELLLNVLFLSLFLYGLENVRVTGSIFLGKANDFGRITLFCGICCVLAGISFFLPVYGALFLFCAVVMSASTNGVLGCCYVGYLNIVTCMETGKSREEMAAYFFMIVAGCLLSQAFRKKRYFIPAGIILFLLNTMTLQIFYYLDYGMVSKEVLIYGMSIGAVTVIFVRLCYDKLYVFPIYDSKMACLSIIQEKYKLVQEIKKYSKIDYEHARKVSQVCYQCAEYLGINSALAMAAGFYYRVGKLEGEPFVENGVRLAVVNHFPEEVVKILYEYNGELKMPSTLESALVHMVDCIVTKTELIEEVNSTWNTEMMIYQTLNEKSSQGLYDRSGMSMNQFLKVREFLAKKEGLF